MAKNAETQDKKRDPQDVVLQQFKVTLGGKVYVVHEKPMKETTEFRRKVGELLMNFADPFLDDMESGAIKEETEGGGKVKTREIIRRMLPSILAEGVDGLIELLWAYAPELRRHEAEATNSEILDAALEVLKITFPLIKKTGESILAILKQAGIELT